MKVLFLVPYPLRISPSQRFRFEQYFDVLSSANIQWKAQSFLNNQNRLLFYSGGKPLKKVIALLGGFIKRWFILCRLFSFDYVFIHREAAPVGPPVFEWIIAKIFRKRIIYDFDDAIWLTDKKNESVFEKFTRYRSKVKLICRWSYKVSCGNAYLCKYARSYNANVVLNPTTLDTKTLHNPEIVQKARSEKITIGWTGSHSTLKYLKEIEGVITHLEAKYPAVQLLVIADRRPELSIRSLTFVPWNKQTETEDLARIDIGIMPLPDDEWSKGKCGFKALQYMAMEIPTVVSPVGVNAEIVEPGNNGYFATTEQEWITSLEALINDPALRNRLGKNGRKKIVDQYSVLSNSSTFLGLFS